MSKHYKKCLYIHGLHSDVNQDKIDILKKNFKDVLAPHFDYGHQPESYQVLRDLCRTEQVDFVVGSSFGGYLGFHLSKEFQIPCVLFNPALFIFDADKLFVLEEVDRRSPFSLVVIGDEDKIIPKGIIDKYVDEHPEEKAIRVIHCRWLEHTIDLNTFEVMVQAGLLMTEDFSSN